MESRRNWIVLGAGSAPREILLIRAAVGSVFLTSGLLKFLYENQGVGRFTKIGLPSPAALATLVGVVEIVGGACLLVGLLTRLAALPLVVDMLVALATTKVPLLFGVGPEPVNAPPKTGLWAFLYQSRLDATMLLACLFLALVGAGAWSLDHWLVVRRSTAGTATPVRAAA
jgi:putative oxidoreductase